MLRITRKVEYALIALRHLQQAEKGQLASAKSMASIYGIPQELLAKILQRLSKENIVQAVKGPKGGYKISSDPKEINMTEFLKLWKVQWGLWIAILIPDVNS